MRILCVCDHGSNRSVHIADQLRYQGHETIPVGASTTSQQTRDLLAGWCDLAIFTDPRQIPLFPTVDHQVWPIDDVYPRPYNPSALTLVRQHIRASGLAKEK